MTEGLAKNPAFKPDKALGEPLASMQSGKPRMK
jgi:hypothetical protein